MKYFRGFVEYNQNKMSIEQGGLFINGKVGTIKAKVAKVQNDGVTKWLAVVPAC